MDFKTLSVVVTDAEVDRPTVEAALEQAERTGAHLEIHCVGVEHLNYATMPMETSPGLLEREIAEARGRATELGAAMGKLVQGAATGTSIEEGVVPAAGLTESLGRLLRYSDLVLCTQPYTKGAGDLQVAAVEGALFHSGAPVLVVGPQAQLKGTPRRVMVAWDESDGALRAVRRAMPMLEAAQTTEVVIVGPDPRSPERADPGGALCIMLARHRVRAEVSVLARQMPRVSEDLLRHARESGADVMVMGAYGKSRLREAMLGGVTRESLANAQIPLFMAR